MHNHIDVFDYEAEYPPASIGLGERILPRVNDVVE